MTDRKKSSLSKRKSFSRWLFWILLMVFLGICLYVAFFSTFLEIDEFSVRGSFEIPSEEIAIQVEKAMEGRCFKYFSCKNYFFIVKKNISSALTGSFNRLEVGAIQKQFPNRLTLDVIERRAEIIWCSAGVCYLTAEDGLIYDGIQGQEAEMRNANYLVVVDDRARTVDIGKTRISPDFIRFVKAADKMLRDDLEIPPSDNFHTPEMASGEVSVATSENWKIKLSSSLPLDEEKKIIQTLFEKELNPDARKNLEYLDLRVRSKAYYKMKEEENHGTLE